MSSKNDVLEKIRKSLIDLDEEMFLNAIKEALSKNVSVEEIIFEAMNKAMKTIGEFFEHGEYFIADLIVAAEMFKKAMNILNPIIEKKVGKDAIRFKGKVVLGTVKGDVHDVGKSLVASMLRAMGYEVIDLGVDVPPEKFVEAVKEYKPDVVGMSALLTTTVHQMEKVIELLKKEGLRDKVIVVIGGLPTSPQYAERIGADGWGKNAMHAMQLINELLRKHKVSKNLFC